MVGTDRNKVHPHFLEGCKRNNMKIMINKITPKGGATWWVKWLASLLLLISLAFTSNNIYPLNLFFMIVGTALWGWVGYIWHDRSLLLLNGVSCVIAVTGLIKYLVGR
jgi:hypothetical protein